MEEHRIVKEYTLYMQKHFKYVLNGLGLILAFSSVPALGQNFKKNIAADAAFSIYSGEQLFALSLSKTHAVGKKKKILLGYGLRYNMYLGVDKNYVTAPAELTSGKTGPVVFFTENITENMDSFVVNRSLHHGFNSVIYIGYRFNDNWSALFNIDAFGFTVGPKVEGDLVSDKKPPSSASRFLAKPTKYNLLLISDNDIGLLNSELYLQYKNPQGYGFRFGASFLFTEYNTTSQVTYNFDNDRFRKKSLMGMVAVTWWPFE